MAAYPAAPPVRILTPDQRAAIRYFYRVRWGVGTFLTVFLPLGLAMPIGAAWHSFGAVVALGLGLAGALNLLRYWLARRKMARAAFIYEHGQAETVTFAGLRSNYSFKVNGQPQPVIKLLRGGEPLQIKTFDDRIIQAFSLPRQTVYIHPDYPDVLVPSGLFALDRSAGRRVRPRSVGV